MVEANSKKTNYASAVISFAKSHQLTIGLSLTILGVVDLWVIMPYLWISAANWKGFYLVMPQWNYTIPALLTIILAGTLILCDYAIRIPTQKNTDRKLIGILLASIGFVYVVIGAWPLWSQPFPWPWQQEIAKYGNLLVLPLFVGSLLALTVGAGSLYVNSRLARKMT